MITNQFEADKARLSFELLDKRRQALNKELTEVVDKMIKMMFEYQAYLESLDSKKEAQES